MKKYLMILVTAMVLPSMVSAATVTPDGGATGSYLGSGQVLTIKWNDDLVADQVDVALWNADDQTFTVIANNLPAHVGEFNWYIPPGLPMGQRYRFVVRDAMNPGRFDMSGGWVALNMPQPLVSGMEEIDHAEDVVVTPMPAVDHFTIAWGDRSVKAVELVDLHHRRVAVQDVEPGVHHVRMELSGIPSGMVFVRLHNDQGASVAKPLIVNH